MNMAENKLEKDIKLNHQFCGYLQVNKNASILFQ